MHVCPFYSGAGAPLNIGELSLWFCWANLPPARVYTGTSIPPALLFSQVWPLHPAFHDLHLWLYALKCELPHLACVLILFISFVNPRATS